ncbi:M56 family metallopeptidase [uncultured Flavobacterium sp.]|uniref:M56 family metallopeptidase n=1 Tax=uncultured Flavobacterium sp. TaxID=165435 RepID=UPI0025FD58B0|nr:M56 family metallopeptidase [uncultured Flavobacterium sp.]
MIAFLIKSSLCLILLLGVYKFFLEKEKISVFNRFYLLGSLIISFAIPFVKFELQQDFVQHNLLPDAIQTIQGNTIIINQKSNSFSIILWTFYAIITTLFVIRFGKNIYEFISKIKANPKERFEISTLVLIEEKILPHTFLNYIFINRNDYENRKIEGELFVHELTHVRQKHTLDILFIEILKTIFWFNPILIFYKKAIQLNHEFLADEKVVKSYNNVPFYQNLLLEKASWNSNFYLASNLNFLVTKKRLIMMTKTTSKSRALLKKLSVLPVLAGLVFISCSQNSTEKMSDEKIVASTWESAKALSSEKTVTNANEAIEVAEVDQRDVPTSPQFPGGMEAFYKFVAKEFKMPKGFSGKDKVILTFVVKADGNLEGIKVIKDAGFGTGEEAVRIMKKSPKWNPGLKDGKPVRIQYHLPIQLES